MANYSRVGAAYRTLFDRMYVRAPDDPSRGTASYLYNLYAPLVERFARSGRSLDMRAMADIDALIALVEGLDDFTLGMSWIELFPFAFISHYTEPLPDEVRRDAAS